MTDSLCASCECEMKDDERMDLEGWAFSIRGGSVGEHTDNRDETATPAGATADEGCTPGNPPFSFSFPPLNSLPPILPNKPSPDLAVAAS